MESPPLASIQAIGPNWVMSRNAETDTVFPLRSRAVRIGESLGTSSSEVGFLLEYTAAAATILEAERLVVGCDDREDVREPHVDRAAEDDVRRAIPSS